MAKPLYEDKPFNSSKTDSLGLWGIGGGGSRPLRLMTISCPKSIEGLSRFILKQNRWPIKLSAQRSYRLNLRLTKILWIHSHNLLLFHL